MCNTFCVDEFATLFNQGKYFEAHEVLEQIWSDAEPGDKAILQGLIQIAALMHLISQNRLVGADKVYKRACVNLQGAPEFFQGINLALLQQQITNIVENQGKISYTDVKIALNS